MRKGLQEPTVRPWSEAVSSGHGAEEAQAVPGVKHTGDPTVLSPTHPLSALGPHALQAAVPEDLSHFFVPVLRGQADQEDRSPRRRRPVGQAFVRAPQGMFLTESTDMLPLSPGLWLPIIQLLLTLLLATQTRAIMSRCYGQVYQHCRPVKGLQAHRNALGLVGAQALVDQEEDATSFSLSCFTSSFPSASRYCLILGTKKEVSATEMLSPPQGPQTACSFPTSIKATPSIKSDQGSSRQEEGGPSTLQTQPDAKSLIRDAIDDKVAPLVLFLLLKYRTKEPITKTEMLNSVIKDKDHFPVIFSEASRCMQLVFGIDVKKVDPAGHSYVLAIALGLTYDGMLNDFQSVPKVGLLINILGVIFLEGDCAPEKVIWEMLGIMGVHAGREHFIYGEPRKLITHDWVREKYLEYRQVPGSDPACYEFLWGPRAHAETSKMKILEFLAKVNDAMPEAFLIWYEEAVRDEEKGSQARVVVRDNRGARASARSRATTSSLCPKRSLKQILISLFGESSH
ncbi:melanoma-associated antigen 4 [Eulemur rufifrons]|uniref:melanoma-associated antigen 4 n=1 Tax=Eulemur rufifrons TaxID=859984 RepID=UPI003742E531